MKLESIERHTLTVHLIWTVIAAAMLFLPLGLTLGHVVFGLVLLYNLMVPIAAKSAGHDEVFRLWLFLVPLSAFQVLPDYFLADVIGVLVFPEIGFPQFGPVSAFMAGMWTIPLFVIVFVSRRIEARQGRQAGLLWAALLSFLIFVGSEATLWRLSIWHAENVHMTAHVAWYVVLPEVLLGLSTFLAFDLLGKRAVVWRILGALAVSAFYLGNLGLSYLLIERILF